MLSAFILCSPGAVALQIGALTIRWYGVFIGLGFIIATWVATFLCKRTEVDTDAMLNGSLASFLGGILGARLYFVALNWQTYAVRPQDILAIWQGGLSIHGGIAGGIIAAWLYCRFTKFPHLLQGLDIAGSVLPLAQAIGRWGNFFNSEAFGQPVPNDFPLKLYIAPQYRPEQYADYQYFHPTFLYESVWNLFIFTILFGVIFEKTKKYPGMNFLAYLFLYSLGRAAIEPIRVDSIMVSGYAAPSLVSIALCVISAASMVATWLYYQKRRPDSKDEGSNLREQAHTPEK